LPFRRSIWHTSSMRDVSMTLTSEAFMSGCG
jgi:hypothetical protein